VTLAEKQALLHVLGVYRGCIAADPNHLLRTMVNRLLGADDGVRNTEAGPPSRNGRFSGTARAPGWRGFRFNARIQDTPALAPFGRESCFQARQTFPEFGQWLLVGTSLQMLQRIEFVTRETRFT
jgi:hypothetical protein